MQHLLPIWKTVKETGIHSMPFDVTQRFSVVDLGDVAEVAAKVLTEPGHDNATYPLAGSEALSQRDMAQILSGLLGKPVRAEEKSLDDFRKEATAAGMPAVRIDTMCTMLKHYGAHGLTGNPNILAWLLGRPPTTFREFVRRDLLNR
jgi:nucleoside-diphosphate-sugar epimerase